MVIRLVFEFKGNITMKSRVKRVYIPKIRAVVLVGIACILLILLAKIASVYRSLVTETGLSPVFIFKIFFSQGVNLSSSGGRTNILILGVGGENHAGGDLTDTMMLVSFAQDAGSTVLISLPRDIWSDMLKDKINSAYHYGEVKRAGGGMILSRVVAEDILGIMIHYSVVVDFAGFEKIIDTLGGLDVDVQQAFTDSLYPVSGKENDDCDGDPLLACRYQTVSFKKGRQHLEGERALVYVRSRYSPGASGSDFARNSRQQEIIAALKDRLLETKQLFSWTENRKLYAIAVKHIRTDLNISEIISLLKKLNQLRINNLRQLSVSEMFIPGERTVYGDKYVLVPKDSWARVYDYIYQQLNQ
ncbi:hypothetical protein A2154_04175 [Candidatus Gottesmanbacteria bacterium RBG_16_43_7]|uniref:Cell envelope-related transcriptional attenuator domain-containing protein n=1 Tax=Candidatus Gottesmanbacteria bacterium RBG_16_43_7 TaxID=1798373 RepID=A0A1F5Z9C7_9BACT|nr:MAG: hypothetical protein A2154_04175 [Candidatus Gottesmanbacteria bacterium RBG_16_43_7]